MGKTLSEKIIAKAAGLEEVSAGDIVWVDVDCAMTDDVLGPRIEIADRMKEIRDEVWDRQKAVIISDHYVPPATPKQAEIVKFTRDWSMAHGIENFFEYIGPCHQILAEKGFDGETFFVVAVEGGRDGLRKLPHPVSRSVRIQIDRGGPALFRCP